MTQRIPAPGDRWSFGPLQDRRPGTVVVVDYDRDTDEVVYRWRAGAGDEHRLTFREFITRYRFDTVGDPLELVEDVAS